MRKESGTGSIRARSSSRLKEVSVVVKPESVAAVSSTPIVLDQLFRFFDTDTKHGKPHHEQVYKTRELLPLRTRLFSKAKVVTMEPKYVHCGCIAEFYCTITSPMFAMCVMMWLIPPLGFSSSLVPQEISRNIHDLSVGAWQQLYDLFGLAYLQPVPSQILEASYTLSLTPLTNLCIILSIMTASVSTLYHFTLFKLWSSMDAGMATIFCYCLALQIWSPFIRERMISGGPLGQYGNILLNILAPDSDAIDRILLSVGLMTVLVLSIVFTTRWDKGTAALAPKLMAIITPVIVIGLFYQHAYGVILCGALGIVCFFVDRKGCAMTHPFWHFFGGLFVWWSIWRSAEVDGLVRLL